MLLCSHMSSVVSMLLTDLCLSYNLQLSRQKCLCLHGTMHFFSSLKYVLFCVRFPYNNQLSLMCSLIKCFLKNAYHPPHHSALSSKSTINLVMQDILIIQSQWLALMELSLTLWSLASCNKVVFNMY